MAQYQITRGLFFNRILREKKIIKLNGIQAFEVKGIPFDMVYVEGGRFRMERSTPTITVLPQARSVSVVVPVGGAMTLQTLGDSCIRFYFGSQRDCNPFN